MKKILVVTAILMLMAFTFTSCGLAVPRPEIRRGEFDFSVTYELNGEIETVSGVYVCEYSGIDFALDGENHRDWKGYVKDGTEESIKLATAKDGGVVELNLHFEPGRFMGDSYYESEEPFSPWITVRLYDEGLYFENDAELIAKSYGARIISYEYDEPIKNSFGLFK